MPRCERGGAGSIPAGHPDRSRAPPNGRQPVPKTGVVVMSPRGSIPPLSSVSFHASALSANGRRPGSHPGNGGFDSPQRHAGPLRLAGSGSPAFIRETRVRIPQRSPPPRRVDRGQRYERRLGGSNPPVGTKVHDLAWRRRGCRFSAAVCYAAGPRPRAFDSLRLLDTTAKLPNGKAPDCNPGTSRSDSDLGLDTRARCSRLHA